MHEIEKLARSKYWRAEQAEVVVEAWRSSEEPATVFGRRPHSPLGEAAGR